MKDHALAGPLQRFPSTAAWWPAGQAWLQHAHARSLAFGLRPEEAVDLQPVDAADLSEALDQHRLLCTHARPVMETLAEQLRDTQSMVVLTDAQGVILHAQGDEEFLGRAGRVALRPGAVWSEQRKGTNAIGTALAEGQPIQVLGAQHYLQANQFLACSCAPIRSPQGEILGTLDVSGDPQGHSPHTLALVRMSAAMVENQLFNTLYAHAVRVRFHANAQLLGTLLEGWAAFSDEGLLQACNRSAQAQWGGTDPVLRWRSFEELLGVSWQALLQRCHGGEQEPPPLRLTLPSGIAVHARLAFPERWTHRVHAAPASPAPMHPLEGRAAVPPQAAPSRPASALERLHAGDARMQAIVQQLQRIRGHDIPLLLQGETGTGKEWLARAYHQDSPRADGPFVAVNCGAIPEQLIESELFGYEEGAFTGARRRGQVGQILRAQGGTLFLDEIGDMPLALQARLLRVLQEREVMPLGAGQPRPVDVRIVCATHRDLRERMAQGLFREDLYYRIHGLCVQLPPLRERTDFAGLVQRMLQEMRAAAPSLPAALHPEALTRLQAHDWPGNLRQLANGLRLAALLAQGEPWITVHHLPQEFQHLPTKAATPRSGADMEPQASPAMMPRLGDITRQALERALQAHGGNVSAAARALGVSRNTMYRRLRASRY